MGGLRRIFNGMAEIMAQAENKLADEIETIVGEENSAADTSGAGGAAGGAGGAAGGDSFVDAPVADAPGAATVDAAPDSSSDGLATAELIGLQYDVQRFSIYNNITTNTMQSVAGAYQGITGNLNFR